MPITTGSTQVEYPNVRVLHMTKNNTPDETVNIAFSVIDEQGTEQIVQAQCPTAAQLFQALTDLGWLTARTARPISGMKRVG
jgi:hypothetical protein